MCWLDSREDLGQGIWADPSPIHLQPVSAWLGAGRPQGLLCLSLMALQQLTWAYSHGG